MQSVLVMFMADGERRSFSLTRDMIVIGRRDDCDMRIPLGEVSRKHCRLIRDGEIMRVEDLGSSNGTFVNGQRVQEAILTPGDSVQVGPVVFVLQVDGHPADEELTPITVQSTEQQGDNGEQDVTTMPGGEPGLDDLGEMVEPLSGSGFDESQLAALGDSDTSSGESHAQIEVESDLPKSKQRRHA